MKFTLGLLALAATALAGGDWDKGHGGGLGGMGSTIYTTVTVCPVTNTFTDKGTTVYETSLTTSTIVVTAPCEDCGVTVPGPTVTEGITKTIDVTYTTACPVTETVTLPGTTKINVYTTTSVVVTQIHTVVTATVELPDVTATEVATALVTLTSLCPVTETKTISGEVVTVTYTTTSLVATVLHTIDVEYTTVPTTKAVEVTDVEYTTLLTTEKVTHDVYTTVTSPVHVVTTVVKGETKVITETNVEVVTVETSYVVTEVIPVTETHKVAVTEAVTVTGPGATETKYEEIDVTVSGTEHKTYTQVPPTQTVVLPSTNVVSKPGYGTHVPTTTAAPSTILPGAAYANNAPAAAFVVGIIGVVAML